MELNLDNLSAVRILGRGAMGTVFLVTDRSSDPPSPPFALKVIDKSSKPDSDRRGRWELHLLSKLSGHPFLPSLLGSLETPSLLAYALPYCPGGDLNSLRHSLSDRVLSPSALRFYLSETLSALLHLHSLHIVYRDLKPENLLLRSDGHLTLSDFDLSRLLLPTTTTTAKTPSPSFPSNPNPNPNPHRRNLTRILFSPVSDTITHHLKKAKSARVSPVSRRRLSLSSSSSPASPQFEKSNSFVGTEEYVAPEIINGDGHDFAVDFWALGILTYEMTYGKTPFKGKNRKETFRNVLTKQPEFVGKQRSDLTDLIGRLLVKDPTRRLGYLGGVEEVKAHPFFHGVQWDILADVSRPPYFAALEDLEEAAAAGSPGGENRERFDVREYFERIRSPPAEPREETSLTEF